MTQPEQKSYLAPAVAAWGSPAHAINYWQWLPQSGRAPTAILFAVHGLTRQGLDFSALAEYLTAQHDVLVVAPDVAGRGQSAWLTNPMHYHAGVYAGDLLGLIAQVQAKQAARLPLAWLGTSMGGLIAFTASSLQADFCDKLILNDVGPRLEWQALTRIGEYLALRMRFASQDEALAYLQSISPSFGWHTPEQWRSLNLPQIRHVPSDAELPWHLHYDPALGALMKSLSPELVQQQEAMLWAAYDKLSMPTLVLRGAQSDLLSAETAQEMQQRGPRAQCVEVPDCGHAPTLIQLKQMQVVEGFLFPLQSEKG